MANPCGSPTVLIVTAGMGGGHTGAARELARRASAAGFRAPIFDLLEGMRFGYGRFIAAFYHAQLRFAPWTYQVVYELWRRRPGLVATANQTNTRMARQGLLQAIEEHQPGAVLSTYNMASQVLGELTRAGEISVPVHTFVTDFGFHPYWTHEATAGYFCVHDRTADAVAAHTGADVVVTGPFVPPAFRRDPVRRASTRRSLGITPSTIAPLVVAGAWGVGDIDRTVADVTRIPGCTPIVVCGHNRRLARRLQRRTGNAARILGFVDDMPALMDGADVLVENAGGLTAMEAFASNLPVLTYRPIPAHGTDNAQAMAAAGVSRFASDRAHLASLLPALAFDGPSRRALIDAGSELFRPDAMSTMLWAMDPTSAVAQPRHREARAR